MHGGAGGGLDSPYAWARLVAAAVIATAGGISMWSVVVLLPSIQVGFGVDRATATIPYTVTMIGAALGQVAMGRLVDTRGIRLPVLAGGVLMAVGYVISA